MKRKFSLFLISLVFMGISGCQEKKDVDIILYNGIIYTVDKNFSIQEAVVIRDGLFVETGSSKYLKSHYHARKRIDLKGRVVYPGLYDPHCHFSGYAESLSWADLTGTQSFDEICKLLVEHKKKQTGEWILGRGWDQNDWENKQYPDRTELDKLFQDQPVLLIRVDGHGAIANAKALELAGITPKTTIDGGDIIVKNGRLTGVLVDNAVNRVRALIRPADLPARKANLLLAQNNCFAVGLTSLADAGLEKEQIELIDGMQKDGDLKIRIYAMLTPSQENLDDYVKKGHYKTDHLHVRTVKLYVDGALGSRGALLKAPYSDAPGKMGLQVSTTEFLTSICRLCYDNNFQVATHCIGDAANHLMLTIYKDILQGKNDKRWRIEHAQIISPEDFKLFGENCVVPSIQTTHATSDMYWASERIGDERVKGAYAYKQLLSQNGWLPNGSDFPVEDINPLYGFFAGFARMDQSGYPAGGWQMENALSREESLKAMTIWAARSCFEENERGSIESDKMADFVILDQDIMTAAPLDVPKIKVLETWLGGEQVYHNN